MLNRLFPLLLIVGLVSCVKSGGNSSPKSEATTNTAPTTNPTTPSPTPTVAPTITPTPVVQVDPLKTYAWHLDNTGQSTFSNSGGTNGIDLNLPNYSITGAGVLVAVSDNGVEGSHPDLAANFDLANSKDYGSTNSGYYGDPTPGSSSHGTSVSGIIAARKDNGLGSHGIAPLARIAGLKFIGVSVNLNKYIDQANGIYDIFNYSYGGYTCQFESVSQTYINQLNYGTRNLRNGRGAIYVKAAGNEYYSNLRDCFPDLEEDNRYYLGNANLEPDHSYPYYIVAAAINASGVSSSYSSPGSSLWISGPGGEFGTSTPAILTTDLVGCDRGYSQSSANENNFESGSNLNQNCDYTSTMNGTSSAAPMIAGVAALLLQANPNLSWRDVKHILASTATKIDPTRGNSNHPLGDNLNGHTYQLGWITNAAGYNFHNWYGFGLANTSSALTMAATYNYPLGTWREDTISSGNNLNLSIPDESGSGRTHSINMNTNRTIEAIQIKLDITHSYIGDLGIELTSPSGTKSILMNINSGIVQQDIDGEVLLTNAFYGESSQGNWQLKIIDGAAQDTGTLNNWELKVYGH